MMDFLETSPTRDASRPQVQRLAGPLQRFWAALIDSLVLVLVVGIGYYGGRAAGIPIPEWNGLASLSMETRFLLSFGVSLAINLPPLRVAGQTWGKRWMGIAVVAMDGRKPALWRLAVRLAILSAFLASSNFLFGILYYANLLPIFSAGHRCGHDFIVGTKVIDLR